MKIFIANLEPSEKGAIEKEIDVEKLESLHEWLDHTT